jgi:hypothetical protein
MAKRIKFDFGLSERTSRGGMGLDDTEDELLNPLESVLFAQVRRGDPEMRIDEEGCLRHKNWPGTHGSLYLGDVADVLLRCFGPHEPPRVSEEPGLDQQVWTIVASNSELSAAITSRSYWGFGLFNACFLNEILLVGPLVLRARLVYDLAAALGRNPWEAVWQGRFAKATETPRLQSKDDWENLIAKGHEDIAESITEMRSNITELTDRLSLLAEDAAQGWNEDDARASLANAIGECGIASDALHDRSATGVERALARAEAAMIEADPTTEVIAQHIGGETLADLEVDEDLNLEEVILTHEQLPEESTRSSAVSTEDTESVQAGDLLSSEEEEEEGAGQFSKSITDTEDDTHEDIPFVDLASEQE